MRVAFFSIMVLILFSQCATTYVPTSVNVPSFSNQGEFQARALFGSNGGDVTFGYAPTKHLGVMMNISTSGDAENTSQYPRNSIEFGAGYYSNVNGRRVWEAMGGIGRGNLHGDFNFSGNEFFSEDVTYSKFFLQPAIGWTTDILDVSFATRLSIIGMEPANAPEEVATVGFIEPVVTLGLGFRWLKVQAQGGLSMATLDPLPYSHTNYILNIGLAARIGKKFY